MKSANSFYRQDLAGREQAGRLGDYTVGLCLDCLAGVVCEPDSRPTNGARNRLCVKTTVGDVRVLSAAFYAHFKDRHRRIRPVVGDIPYYRIPRPAVGAVYEWIAVPKVVFVGHFRKAVGAGCHVGGHLRQRGSGRIARLDNEPAVIL